jgi:hypothetical protein
MDCNLAAEALYDVDDHKEADVEEGGAQQRVLHGLALAFLT